jgi:hypothetical protein
MEMKKLILLALFVSAMPFKTMAQDDDLYFVPSKENLAKDEARLGMPSSTYYSGSPRTVDDYNHRTLAASSDSTGNDIIDFSAVRGVYPDSTDASMSDNDYQYTRRMSRFDGYTPDEAYWAGYSAGRWSSPWYSSWYSWYDPGYYWYDPWYYGGYYGWYSPWYYSSWYSPWSYGWGGYLGWRGYYGTSRYYAGIGSGRSWSRTGVSHHKSTSSARTQRGTSLGGYRSQGSRTGTTTTTTTRSYEGRSLGGTRSSSSSSSGSFGSGSSGGSFGGSRSSGSSGGGRSVGGGHSYGGRR